MQKLKEEKINGQKVKIFRERKGLSQRQLGVLVGAHQGGINSLEHEYKSPNKVYRSTSFEKAVRLAKVLEVSLDYLADRTEDPRPVEVLLEVLAAAGNSTYSAALFELAGKLGLELDELVTLLHQPRTLELLSADNQRLVWTVAANRETCYTLQAVVDGAQKLTHHELRMVQLLVRRLTETSPGLQVETQEASEAARIIDHLSQAGRDEAMTALHHIEDRTISELQKRMNYLMEVVRDLGHDAEALVRERFGDRLDVALRE